MKRKLCEILLPQKKVKKIILIMRLSTILLLFGMLSASASVYSQNKKFSLNLENVSIRTLFQEIEKQSEFSFLYNDGFEDLDRNVSIDIHNKKLEDIMDQVFANTNLSYRILENNLIVLAPKVALQEFKVSGVVIDATSSEPIIGVNVQVEGTTIGVATDLNGNYSLTVPDKNAVLIFSFIGYNTERVAIGGQNVINVKLIEDIKSLEEVVVIGYGTQNKRDISTAIASVSSEDLRDKPVSNFAQAISGKMAGVRISNTNAAPGGGSVINIRGVGSINASTSPLFVIDGFPLKDGFDKNENPLNSINPADIESIEVLKDASSSAIYGTQAANGVVLITTKRGKTGKPTINVNVSTGMQQMIHKIETLGREDFLKYMDDARANAYIIEDPNFGTNNTNLPLWQWTDAPELRISNWAKYSQHASAMAQPGSKHYRWITVSDTCYNSPYDTNWQDVITRVGKVNDVQLSATGGTENVSYMVSGGYFDQEGIVPTSGYNRISFRANVDVNVNKWLKMGLNLAPSIENLDVLSNTEGGNTSNPFYNAVAMIPIWAPRDSKGDPIYYGTVLDGPWDWNFSNFVNPLAQFRKQDNRRTAKNLGSIFAEVKLLKNLTFRSEFHNEFRYWEQNYFIPSNVPTSAQTFSRTEGTNQTSTRLYWNSQNFITYQNKFGKHSLTAMVGYSAEETSYRSNLVKKYDFPSDQIPTLNQATTVVNAQADARSNRSSENMIGSFARLIYNFGSKYYLTSSVRRDGSSKFGKDNKWGIFPSVSLAWRISDENFFAPFKNYISDWKIRGGWGKIGNSGIGNYNALNTLTASSYIFGATSTVTSAYETGKVSNPKLGWETTTDYNVGTDLQFLKNRITLSVDYFYRKTTDMLFNMPLPTITGFGSYMANIGAMRNRGFEWVINSRNIVGEFNWTTDFNIYYYRNRVLDIGKDKRPIIQDDCYTTEGKPLAGIWGMVDLGPFKDWEDVKTSPIFGANSPLWRNRSNPGMPKVADVNGDGILDSSDKTIIGSAFPDFVWGMTNTFEYKGLDLTVQVNGTQGGDISMMEYQGVFGRGAGLQNTTAEYYNNYWRPDRTDAKYAAPTRKNYEGSDLSGTLLYKGTYVNIQNVTLGYALPKSWINKINVNNARIYLNIQNALFITKFPGFNPETNFKGNSTLSQGIDRGSYPLARTISFGVNLAL